MESIRRQRWSEYFEGMFRSSDLSIQKRLFVSSMQSQQRKTYPQNMRHTIGFQGIGFNTLQYLLIQTL
jgi:hypothetical protein